MSCQRSVEQATRLTRHCLQSSRMPLYQNFGSMQPHQKPRSYVQKLRDQYNTLLLSGTVRYKVQDKAPFTQSCEAIKGIRGNLENTYFLRKSSEEKKKCFENIHNVQRQWYALKRRNNIVPQTEYNIESPHLWMRVKNMYSDSKTFVQPYC